MSLVDVWFRNGMFERGIWPEQLGHSEVETASLEGVSLAVLSPEADSG